MRVFVQRSVRALSTARAVAAAKPAPEFFYQPLFEAAKPKDTPFKKLTSDYVSVTNVNGKE